MSTLSNVTDPGAYVVLSLADVAPCSPDDEFFELLAAPSSAASDPVLFKVTVPGGPIIANAMNDNFAVVGESFSADPDLFGAFLWTPATGVQIIGPGNATGISDDSSVVVGQGDGQFGFRWTQALGEGGHRQFHPVGFER